MMQILPAQQRQLQAWKNGGGSTSDVMLFPPDSTLENFLWRVSVANIAQSGPFSSFPGLDRSLYLLSDAQIYLHVAGNVHQIDRDHRLHNFAGETSVHAELPPNQSAVQVLNLMCRRGAYSHRLGAVVLDGELDLDLRAEHTLLFVHQGSCVLNGQQALHTLDAVYAREESGLRLHAEASACLILLEINAIQKQV